MERAKHKKRHKELHSKLDELVADFLIHNICKIPSQTTILELMEWSHKQINNPTDNTNNTDDGEE